MPKTIDQLEDFSLNDLINQNKDQISLIGKEAVDLWLKGSNDWNNWVNEHPEADICFEGVDFSQYRTENTPHICFQNYIFPKGQTSFYRTIFGDGPVLFQRAVFSGGVVDFSYATFGDGHVTFSGVNFGNGLVSFSEASFGDGDVSFQNTTFGGSAAIFDEAKFGNGNVFFSGASFGDGTISFFETAFGDGDIYFFEATFGNGSVIFCNASFGKGEVNFERASFNSHVNFSYLRDTQKITAFTFRNSNFKKSLDLSGCRFDCVIDLTATKAAYQVTLEDVHCRLKRNWYGKAIDHKDTGRLRRLKEIADNNKDHSQALRFHADEMRAKRWHETKPFRGLGLDYCFDWLSNYGQAVGRPIAMLVLITGLFGVFYSAKIPKITHEVTVVDVAIFATSQILPFIPSSRESRTQGIRKLYGSTKAMSYGLHALILFQSGVSFLFLFLIGLGLRNRFRI